MESNKFKERSYNHCSAYNNSKNNIFYGCGAFKDLGICVKKCPIHK